MSIHVSVCGFTVYGGSIIRMDEHVKERNTTCVRGMLDSILKVRSQGVDMLQEGFSMLPVTEMSKTVINEMVVMVGRIRATGYGQVFNVRNTNFCLCDRQR